MSQDVWAQADAAAAAHRAGWDVNLNDMTRTKRTDEKEN